MAMAALESGKSVRLAFGGMSMAPLLFPGDLIRVEPVSRQPRFGEVVLYLSGGVLAAHRVIGRRGRGSGFRLALKGDFTPGGIELIGPEKVLGIVSVRERRGVYAYLESPGFRFAGTVLALASPWLTASALACPGPVRGILKNTAFALASIFFDKFSGGNML